MAYTDGFGDVFTDEEVEQIIGKDSLKTFGQYEEDCVYAFLTLHNEIRKFNVSRFLYL